ncbi:hypothetical protein MPH_03549 [Macrophomina phaseolina MS6]|uniref:Uncharacterized protein n=1 Tax=Macrophomina phaseolina (strain MS6) TaxID=1126212 RepID=K2S9R3_MACPH|nr:hypothetical protein MPH_03549 [Macrophomina phaseolina MS6]
MRGNVGDKGNSTRGAVVERSKERRRGEKRRSSREMPWRCGRRESAAGYRRCLLPACWRCGECTDWTGGGKRVCMRMGAARLWCVGGVYGFAGNGGCGLVGYVQREEVPTSR